MIHAAVPLALLFAAFAEEPSGFAVVSESPSGVAGRSRLVVEVEDGRSGTRLPVRVIVTASDGSHPDGSGRGVYSDGRFFADGRFAVEAPAGPTRVLLRSGPDYEPLEISLALGEGREARLRARLRRWFAPEGRGWYAGDNHVHAQHDATVAIRTDLEYTALQGRANGLSYLTEADSGPDPADIARLSTPSFLFRRAPEVRPGPFVGHFNTPGIARAIEPGAYDRLVDGPLPALRIAEEVHRRGGALIHTHPLTPPHQMHWMGAAELLSDAVLGRPADAMDLDGRASELLWFAVLNLGNRVAASGSTDCALGRKATPSPGDRRVYSRADSREYPAIVAAIREGRTFATDGGPIFPFLAIDGRGPGETLEPGGDRPLAVRAEVHSLRPLRSARLYRRGTLVREFDAAGRRGEVVLEDSRREPPGGRAWYVLRVEDEAGAWAITSPIFVGAPAGGSPASASGPASALVLEIHNATRYVELRRAFFAHLIATVSPGDPLASVELLRDGRPLRRFTPDEAESRTAGKTPVTGLGGEYGPGWAWHAGPGGTLHLQADWPVSESGWYGLRATTAGGRVIASEEVRFDAEDLPSRAITAARLEGPGTIWEHRGYGEEMPLSEIREPFEGDHWWYPLRNAWRVRAEFDGERREVGSGDVEGRFRPAPVTR